jgi:hypothetical protein
MATNAILISLQVLMNRTQLDFFNVSKVLAGIAEDWSEMVSWKVGEARRSLTFGEKDMGRLVHGTIGTLKVTHQRTHRILRRCHQVNRLHGRQWFALLVDVLNNCKRITFVNLSLKLKLYPAPLTGYALGADVVHLGAGRHHSHGQFVNDQHTPLDILGLVFVNWFLRCALVPNHLVHDLCKSVKQE